jgi:hypothetical protein
MEYVNTCMLQVIAYQDLTMTGKRGTTASTSASAPASTAAISNGNQSAV